VTAVHLIVFGVLCAITPICVLIGAKDPDEIVSQWSIKQKMIMRNMFLGGVTLIVGGVIAILT
jgi:hypothetical protein